MNFGALQAPAWVLVLIAYMGFITSGFIWHSEKLARFIHYPVTCALLAFFVPLVVIFCWEWRLAPFFSAFVLEVIGIVLFILLTYLHYRIWEH